MYRYFREKLHVNHYWELMKRLLLTVDDKRNNLLPPFPHAHKPIYTLRAAAHYALLSFWTLLGIWIFWLCLYFGNTYPLPTNQTRNSGWLFLLAVSWRQCLTKCLFYLQSCVNFSPESHAAEKRQLVNEIVSLKKMSDLRERESARRDVQVHQYKSEADKGLTALQEAERKVQNYRIEVSRRFTISMALSANPSHPNISLLILHTLTSKG